MSAASALYLLTGSSKGLERNQIHISSGKDVNKASDNSAYWAIATSMSSVDTSMSALQDVSGLAAATTDTASVGMDAATDIVSQIKAKLVFAGATGVDKDAVNTEIAQLKEQLGSITQSSSFNGENWLNSSAGTPDVKSLPTSVSGGTVNTIQFDTADTTLTSANGADGILTKAYSGTTDNGSAYNYYLLDSQTPPAGGATGISISNSTTNEQLAGMVSAVDSMLSGMTSAGSKLGSTSARIGDNTEFLARMQDAVQRGIGRLVDTDMEESAVKLSAAKAQQQIQLAGLHIANQQSKSILELFR
jgi:flagellin